MEKVRERGDNELLSKFNVFAWVGSGEGRGGKRRFFFSTLAIYVGYPLLFR